MRTHIDDEREEHARLLDAPAPRQSTSNDICVVTIRDVSWLRPVHPERKLASIVKVQAVCKVDIYDLPPLRIGLQPTTQHVQRAGCARLVARHVQAPSEVVLLSSGQTLFSLTFAFLQS